MGRPGSRFIARSCLHRTRNTRTTPLGMRSVGRRHKARLHFPVNIHRLSLDLLCCGSLDISYVTNAHSDDRVHRLPVTGRGIRQRDILFGLRHLPAGEQEVCDVERLQIHVPLL